MNPASAQYGRVIATLAFSSLAFGIIGELLSRLKAQWPRKVALLVAAGGFTMVMIGAAVGVHATAKLANRLVAHAAVSNTVTAEILFYADSGRYALTSRELATGEPELAAVAPDRFKVRVTMEPAGRGVTLTGSSGSQFFATRGVCGITLPPLEPRSTSASPMVRCADDPSNKAASARSSIEPREPTTEVTASMRASRGISLAQKRGRDPEQSFVVQ